MWRRGQLYLLLPPEAWRGFLSQSRLVSADLVPSVCYHLLSLGWVTSGCQVCTVNPFSEQLVQWLDIRSGLWETRGISL